MERKFWEERWENNQIGFHRSAVNPVLEKYFLKLNPENKTVFVPFCGKSLDMVWLLEKGFHVTGCEISRIAAVSFFKENSIPHTIETSGEFEIFSGKNIEIFCGDFFNLKNLFRSPVSVFDRASLVALPPPMRNSYASRMADLLPADSSTLLITMEYPDGEMNGPPFSVKEEEVKTLYSGNFNISRIEVIDVFSENPQFKERGITSINEKVYHLVRR